MCAAETLQNRVREGRLDLKSNYLLMQSVDLLKSRKFLVLLNLLRLSLNRNTSRKTDVIDV